MRTHAEVDAWNCLEDSMPGYQNRRNRTGRCQIPVIAIAFHAMLPHMLTPGSFCLLTEKIVRVFPKLRRTSSADDLNVYHAP